MKQLSLLLLVLAFIACDSKTAAPEVTFTKYDETAELTEQQNHENNRMKFKTIQSKYLDMNEVFAPFNEALASFSEKDYYNMESFLIEKDIPFIQEAIKNRILTYEKIALFYLYRIRKYESNPETALNAIIALNPNILEEARAKDRNPNKPYNLNETLYGLPVLLKDNINTAGMPTTAGAVALQDNVNTDDAQLVKNLKASGALILGKLNLSEWAYYFCDGCPLGYSAIGGQTLNPYGRKVFETGGSSAGSGVATAANYAVVTVGSETSGSILSPSSKNAVVGLKPTIGVVPGEGVVPISTTLDTAGPMTKFVVDNAILLGALEKPLQMLENDSLQAPYLHGLNGATLSGKRFAVLKSSMQDSLLSNAVDLIRKHGAEVIELEKDRPRLEGFLTFLNLEMKRDLPIYLENNADASIPFKSVADVIAFNSQDSIKRMPYNQGRFDGIIADETSEEDFQKIGENLNSYGQTYLNEILKDNNVDAFLSVNNSYAGVAAVAQYPCLTVNMGYTEEGEPKGLTFTAFPKEEAKLLKLGYAYEQVSKQRKLPKGYE